MCTSVLMRCLARIVHWNVCPLIWLRAGISHAGPRIVKWILYNGWRDMHFLKLPSDVVQHHFQGDPEVMSVFVRNCQKYYAFTTEFLAISGQDRTLYWSDHTPPAAPHMSLFPGLLPSYALLEYCKRWHLLCPGGIPMQRNVTSGGLDH